MQDRLTTALADRYAIEQPLGEGGMALVYLARDLKHDRLVAIKVLRPELAASIGPERFLREIHVTAKLSHPHILPLYDSGDAEGLLFYVMPFVEGESLGDMLEREKQLSIDDAIRITKEVAGALGHAHSYGLIHRDVKPDNVMMSGTHAIVADFGIAKALSDAGGTGVTQTGTSIGTPAYMSPEQAAGLSDLDGRSDIYALGCMLYEMLVGQVPFTGPTPQAIMARHTMDQIPPPSIMRDSVMPELEDVIFCAMAKSPADRFRTAQEMIDALTAIETGGAPKLRTTRATRRITQPVIEQSKWKRFGVPALAVVAATAVGVAGWQFLQGRSGGPAAVPGGLDPKRVAVLYFEDLSPDGDLAYVADGITEGLISQLSTVGALSVISRNGVAPFRDPTTPRDSIARVLGVGSLVSGSVEPVGINLRVTARLVEGEGGSDLGRETFQLPAGDLLATQDSVVQIVSNFLRQRLGEEVRTRELRGGTENVAAWGLVQRAERLRKDAEDLAVNDDDEPAIAALRQADSLLGLAQAADPRWPEPIVDRGWIAYQRGMQLSEGPAVVPWLDTALARADEALAVSTNDSRALELRGTTRFRYWLRRAVTDANAQTRLLEQAKEDLESTVESDPGRVRALVELSTLYYELPVPDVPSALRSAERAYEADAYLDNADAVLDRLFWGSIDREFLPQAQRWCGEGARRFPDDVRFARCELWLMVTPRVAPAVDQAWQLRARLDSLTENRFLRVEADFLVGGVLARAELTDSARSVFQRARAAISSEFDPDLALYAREAYVRSLAGDLDEAIDLLKEFTAANPTHDFSQMLGNWWWRELRDHPRWRELSVG